MLSRAFTKPKRSVKEYGENSRSGSTSEYDDCIVGFLDDLPLISCEKNGQSLSLKEVLRTSVSVMGENARGLTEKVVLSNARLCTLKRFRKVIVRKSEFGRRVEKLAQVCNNCDYLVPITAYLYAKRIKLVVSDYYPMGSLADLLSGDFSQFLHPTLALSSHQYDLHKNCLLIDSPPNTSFSVLSRLRMKIYGL